MKIALPTGSLLAPLVALAAPLAAQPLSPDAGAFKAQGSWTDDAKHVGQWHAEGTLAGGRFAGTLALEMLGVDHAFTLRADRAQLRNGTCVLSGEEGKNRVELRGACDSAVIGPGTLSGRFDGHALRGQFNGTMGSGPKPAPEPVPTRAAQPG